MARSTRCWRMRRSSWALRCGGCGAGYSASRIVTLQRCCVTLSATACSARARNAGLTRLLELAPDAQYVQFVDGDCEVMPMWLESACKELERRPEMGVVCGRLRERFPQSSVFNRLCDLEWNSGVGEIRA